MADDADKARLLWHYTTSSNFDSIREDETVRVSFGNPRTGEKSATWFSTNQEWEPTSFQAGASRDELKALHGGLIRIGVRGEAAPIDWQEYCRQCALPATEVQEIEARARQKGAKPEEWRVTFKAVLASAWMAVEEWRDGKWMTLEWKQTFVERPAPPAISPAQLLTHMRVDKHLYVLGCFERRVTLYSQQVRALNLVYALLEERVVPPQGRIAVIGGGAAGMTAAAAAAYRGCQVVLLERQPHLLPLQAGNMTRWLHPHIYDWPQHGSEQTQAGLPLLDWRAGSAGDVAEQMLTAWVNLPPEVTARIETFTSAREVRLEPPDAGPRMSWNSPKGARAQRFSAIILAVGFGEEDRSRSELSRSYWRNDDLNQPDLDAASVGSRRRYLISGCGDGGLVDLLRVRLSNFRHERVVRSFFGEMNSADKRRLVQALLAIETEAWRKQDDPYFLNDRYQELKVAESVDNALARVLREDTEATLLGEDPSALTLRSSILNRFIVSRLLFKFGVQYLRGRFEDAIPTTVAAGRRVYQVHITEGGQKKPREFDAVVLRHGPLSALKRDFEPVWTRAHQAFHVMRELDQTRHPLWSHEYFGPGIPASLDSETNMTQFSVELASVLAALTQEQILLFRRIGDGDLEELPGTFRRTTDPNASPADKELHKSLRILRNAGLVRPRKGGRWLPGSAIELTPLGRLVLGQPTQREESA